MGLFSGGNSSSKTENVDKRATATDNGFAVSEISARQGRDSTQNITFESMNDDALYANLEFAENVLLQGAHTTSAASQSVASAYETAMSGLSERLKEAESGPMAYIVPVILAVIVPVVVLFILKGKK